MELQPNVSDDFQSENDMLLEQTHDPIQDDQKVEPAPEKRNTKKSLIQKIKQLCDQHEIELNQSDTQLNRSSKATLQKLLATKAEEAVTKKLMNSHREKVIQQNGEAREYLALQTLRYGLNTLNRVIDRGCNTILPMYNYRLEGFVEAFDDPRTSEEVKDILLTIMRENPEIISQISNPYIRLAFVYVGAISISIKKVSSNNNNKDGKSVRFKRSQDIQAVRGNDTRSTSSGQVSLK